MSNFADWWEYSRALRTTAPLLFWTAPILIGAAITVACLHRQEAVSTEKKDEEKSGSFNFKELFVFGFLAVIALVIYSNVMGTPEWLRATEKAVSGFGTVAAPSAPAPPGRIAITAAMAKQSKLVVVEAGDFEKRGNSPLFANGEKFDIRVGSDIASPVCTQGISASNNLTICGNGKGRIFLGQSANSSGLRKFDDGKQYEQFSGEWATEIKGLAITKGRYQLLRTTSGDIRIFLQSPDGKADLIEFKLEN